MKGLVFATALWGLLACELDLERMREQPRFDSYEPAAYFDDGTIMRAPPPGTVHRAEALEPLEAPSLAEGDAGMLAVPRATKSSLERGRDRFELFCAPCHGICGDGESQVARAMQLRRPPSLVDPPISAYSPQRVYRVASRGYGLMRGYGAELDRDDRWAVVFYIGALQLSQRAELGALPAHLRADATAALAQDTAGDAP